MDDDRSKRPPNREGGRRADGERPFVKRDGAKPFVKREGSKPFVKRESRPRSDAAAEPSGERIAKRLARAGISSRRDAEELIAAGRVSVNGKALNSPAFNVQPGDAIAVDGMEIPAIERTRLFLFHKPAGVVTTNRDPQGRRTVFDVLPEGLPRLITIGRLDINTEGLLLLTNDGGLARVLELPATGWMRRYRVRVHGHVDESALAGLREGIAVGGVFYGAIEAALDREQGSNAWLTLGLREGKNREVKNVLSSLGLEVNRLIRISYGPFQLADLAEGEVRELKGRTLRDQLGERLIEESGADFEAQVATPFSNKPVAGEVAEPAAPARERGPREEGFTPNRKREREDNREKSLGRLSTTRPERPSFGKPSGFGKSLAGGKPAGFAKGGARGGKGGKREEKPYEPPRSRSSNVWMAPGARPQPVKKDEVAAAAPARDNDNERTPFKRPVGDKPPFKRPDGDKPSFKKPYRPREGASADARPPRRDDERRSRPSSPAGPSPRIETGRRRPAATSPLPPSPRSRGEGPAGDEGQRERPKFKRAEGERPSSKRPDGDKAPFKKAYRPREGASADARPPRRDDERNSRPAFKRPDGDKPAFKKPYSPRSAASPEVRPPRRDDERRSRPSSGPAAAASPGERGVGRASPSKPYRAREGGDAKPSRPPFKHPDGAKPPFKPKSDRPRSDRPKPAGDRPGKPHGYKPKGAGPKRPGR